MVVVMFWCVLGSAGGLPFYLSNANELSITDAVFESIAEGLQEDGVVTIGKWGTYTAEDIANS